MGKLWLYNEMQRGEGGKLNYVGFAGNLCSFHIEHYHLSQLLIYILGSGEG